MGRQSDETVSRWHCSRHRRAAPGRSRAARARWSVTRAPRGDGVAREGVGQAQRGYGLSPLGFEGDLKLKPKIEINQNSDKLRTLLTNQKQDVTYN